MGIHIKNRHLHRWNVSAKEAVNLQKALAPQVEQADRLPELRTVAGVDVGFEQNGEITRAAVVVLDYTSLQPLDVAVARVPTSFPYVPGLLSFREVPAVLEALQQLKAPPDILLCDGQGLAHPRRFGIACHLGVITNLPSIGVGKSRLVGEHGALPDEKGAWVPLVHKQEVVGAVLRSRKGVKPIYVSIGHRVCLETAINVVMHCLTRYKLPETTRWAHHYASELK